MWTSDPDQKLWYSGVLKWARRHCPEVVLGVRAEDEDFTQPETIVVAHQPRTANAKALEVLGVVETPPAVPEAATAAAEGELAE